MGNKEKIDDHLDCYSKSVQSTDPDATSHVLSRPTRSVKRRTQVAASLRLKIKDATMGDFIQNFESQVYP